MIYLEKDPTLKTLLEQEALKARGLYTGALDNWAGPRYDDAMAAFQLLMSPAKVADASGRYRDINPAGFELIKHFEGLSLKAYQDEVGIWTIGYGHTGLTHNDGTVYPGREITSIEADSLLLHDMDVFEGRVTKLISVPLSDNQFSALVSFDFNTGGLQDSTLRRQLNAGNYAAAADEFLRWDYAGGKRLAGLTRRRKSERNLFLSQAPYIVEA